MSTLISENGHRVNDRPAETRPAGALQHEHFDTTDAEGVKRFFERAYKPGWRISGLPAGSAFSHRRFQAESITLDELDLKGRAGYEIRSDESLLVIQPRSGKLTIAGEQATSVSTAIVAAAGMPCVLWADNARFHVASLDVRLLSKVAADRNGPLPQQVQFMDWRPRSDQAAHSWLRALDYVVTTFECADTAQRPLIVSAAGHLLAAATLECFPSNVNAEQALLSSSAVPPVLKSAVSFIHRHAGHGIGINDVATAVRLTPRAVQYLFRQHLDTTPTEFLRRVRLHHAHQDLISSDRSTNTVSEVAQRWGFAHTGRFAALYRRTYGQSPHTTLQQ
ncbi:helix-turn-helix transcriptional regulator [Mycobacterium asiaticum]|uniref:helix-turn-helix transcriptional regulator n=1 Tax=Mycobacterium asiaticum TaxID=1790 RepID=UPI000A611ED9|nr:helix-turn-helix transcriptional regulator [Mycobacterium asiaticum]